MTRSLRPLRRLRHLVREEGWRQTRQSLFLRLATPHPIVALPKMVADEDVVRADWTQPPEHIRKPLHVQAKSIDVAWVTSPPAAASGGHHNVFRFIKALEDAGHRCTVYLYDWQQRTIALDRIRQMLRSTEGYPPLKAEVVALDREPGFDPAHQAIISTVWETSYVSYLDPSTARRFYFVQDFEPWFYPVSSLATLAENTYRFGFHGLTAGRWLADKLHEDYGMETDHYDFGVDSDRYHVTNTGKRRDVFFYARTATPRRGFELGVAALAEFASLRPDVTIHFAGASSSRHPIPFPHVDHSDLSLTLLNELYNRCSAGLVLSLTNMSLLPLELLAAGVTPVVNDASKTRGVTDNKNIAFVPLSPKTIAEKLVAITDRDDSGSRAQALSDSVRNLSWSSSARQFISAFEGAMRG